VPFRSLRLSAKVSQHNLYLFNSIGEIFIKKPGKTHFFINRLQLLTGTMVLLLGVLVYLVDRPPDQTYFVYKTGVDISLHNTLPNLFGIIGQSLPSFSHVFSFILITAGLIAYQKKGYIIICLFWFLIDSAFELGQKFNTYLYPAGLPGFLFLKTPETIFPWALFLLVTWRQFS